MAPPETSLGAAARGLEPPLGALGHPPRNKRLTAALTLNSGQRVDTGA